MNRYAARMPASDNTPRRRDGTANRAASAPNAAKLVRSRSAPKRPAKPPEKRAARSAMSAPKPTADPESPDVRKKPERGAGCREEVRSWRSPVTASSHFERSPRTSGRVREKDVKKV